MIPQPPVTQFTHEEDRNSSDTTSLEAKPAENKPSRGLWLSLCCACTHGQNGEIICTGLNLAMEKKKYKTHACVYWFPPRLLFLVFYVVSALPGAVSTVTASLSHTDSHVSVFGVG